ncbi:MAG: type II toxin-antitoxin system RelB/DinJ family antitoxin [Clostridiales bacterium]|nr:type II toxin-antitoxin system RelB/DinJ family antitoxin [Clostridiales bacterium]
MNAPLSVATAPKTGTFQMRINPEIKRQVEDIYAASGMTLTDAVNVFLQQSINVGGLPFLVAQDSKKALREQAVALLMTELRKGEASVQSESDWISEEEMLAEFGG